MIIATLQSCTVHSHLELYAMYSTVATVCQLLLKTTLYLKNYIVVNTVVVDYDLDKLNLRVKNKKINNLISIKRTEPAKKQVGCR